MIELDRIYNEDALTLLARIPDATIQTCVTSPPYWELRDYGHEGQIGLEKTPEEYVTKMVQVFREVKRVLRDDGTLWLNLGDSYVGSWGNYHPFSDSGKEGQRAKNTERWDRPAYSDKTFLPPTALKQESLKRKDMCLIPHRVALGLQGDGWWLRSDIVWAKPNGMPNSQNDRPTSSHESIFLLAKSEIYFSDFDAIKTPARESTRVRLSQDVQAQAGSHRANGGEKTNGPMKAVGIDKQRGHSRRHAGFNDRWDRMTKAEQQAKPAMMRDVWFVPPEGYSGAHFAVMPKEIARRCILAGSHLSDTILDPFMGAGTTAVVAERLNRHWVGAELNAGYCMIARRRIDAERAQTKLAL